MPVSSVEGGGHAPEPLAVAAGVVQRPDGRVLISERPAGKPLAGLLEFPGGKIETGETPEAALSRELQEELGIRAGNMEQLIRFVYDYPQRRVHLHVYRLTRWSGEPEGREGQRLEWLDPTVLHRVPMLPANRPVIAALSLPRHILVTPSPGSSMSVFLRRLDAALTGAAIDAVVLREAPAEPSVSLQAKVAAIAADRGIPVILNTDAPRVIPPGFAGLHLTARGLRALDARPAGTGWVGASVHNVVEAALARRLEIDYVFVGNVKATGSHPGRIPLGWKAFEEIAGASGLPAFAIGGVGPEDMDEVRARWGHGVAAISAFWPQMV